MKIGSEGKEQEMYKQAVQMFEKGVELKPDDAEAHLELVNPGSLEISGFRVKPGMTEFS